MCLIIAADDHTKIKPEWIENGWESNDDGAGFAFHRAGDGLVVRKGFFTLKSLQDAWDAEKKEGPAIIHFRFATHGTKNEDNCHPFLVGGHAVAHNGIFTGSGGYTDPTGKKSDTRIFLERYAEEHGEYFDQSVESFMDQWEKLVSMEGSGSKLAILSRDPNKPPLIVNRKLGDEPETGVWMSNTGYKASRWSYGNYSGWDFDEDRTETKSSSGKSYVVGDSWLDLKRKVAEGEKELTEAYENIKGLETALAYTTKLLSSFSNLPELKPDRVTNEVQALVDKADAAILAFYSGTPMDEKPEETKPEETKPEETKPETAES